MSNELPGFMTATVHFAEKQDIIMIVKDEYAIVTGASSGIGKAIVMSLCDEGYVVYGIGRSFEPKMSGGCDPVKITGQDAAKDADPDPAVSQKHDLSGIANFHPIVSDMLQTEAFLEKICQITETENKKLKILVNAAGAGYYGLHHELSAEQIRTMVRTNLEIPMILTGKLLPLLKKNKGTIINISSITAHESNPHGCAYGATKAGLSSFSKSIFDENRKHGLRVITVHPDMTKTALYRNADFDIDEEDGCYLLPEDTAEPLIAALRSEHTGSMEITLQPQFHRIRKKTPKKVSTHNELYSLFCCTEAMKHILDQSLYYFSLADIDYLSEIARMKDLGELPCKNKKEGMERIEQLKQRLIS